MRPSSSHSASYFIVMEKLFSVMNKASSYDSEELQNQYPFTLDQLALYEFHFNNTTRCKNKNLNENRNR